MNKNSMNNKQSSIKRSLIIGLVMGLMAHNAAAHKRWVLPSLFTVSEQQWVAVDATVSNNIFYPDRPWSLETIKVMTPDGGIGMIENKQVGHRRSTFDVNLNQQGTFKISSGGVNYFARYPKLDAKPDERPFNSIRGNDLQQLKSKIPADAKDVKLMLSNSRLESYVTVGAPTTTVFKPTNSGIELIPVTHPNDLYQGEKAQFKFSVDGKWIANLNVLMVWEGTRYRNAEQTIELKTDETAVIEIDLSQTGRFLLEIEHAIEMPEKAEFAEKTFAYFGSFEVLPQ